MEALRIIIEFFGIVITAVLTYLFTRSHYERKRRDELADRKSNRRIKFRDSNLEDVQAFIHTYMDLTLNLSAYESAMAKVKVNDTSLVSWGFDQATEKMTTVQKYIGSFLALDDPLLSTLSTLVVQTFAEEFANAIDLEEMIGNEQEFDEEAVSKRIQDADSSINSLLSVMQRRLNELVKLENK